MKIGKQGGIMQIRVYAEQHNDERTIENILNDLYEFQPDIVYHELCIAYDKSILGDDKCFYIDHKSIEQIGKSIWEYETKGLGNVPTVSFPIDIANFCLENQSILASLDIPFTDAVKLRDAPKSTEHQARETYMTNVLMEELDGTYNKVAVIVGAAHLRTIDSKISGGYSLLRSYLDSRDDVTYANPFVIEAANKEALRLERQGDIDG